MGAKYKEITKTIERDILEGKYENINKLPTIEELMKAFNVSKNTMRAAIDLLVTKGYIYQVQGSGIFIRPTSRDGYINISNMRGLSKDLENKEIVTKVLKFELTKADKNMAEKMRCKVGTELYHVKRLRIVDDEPFSIEDSFFNKDIVTYLNNEIVQNSIYEYITQGLKHTIGFADKVIYCEKQTVEETKLIGLEEGEVALVIENVVYLSNGLVFDVSKSKYNYNNTKLISLANYR